MDNTPKKSRANEKIAKGHSPLNNDQAAKRVFALEYCFTGRVKESYIKAWPDGSSIQAQARGWRMLDDPEVQAVIKEEMVAMEKHYRINKGYIIKEIQELMARCLEDDDRSTMVKCLDMLNKMSGSYVIKHEMDIRSEQIVINVLSSDHKEINNSLTEEIKFIDLGSSEETEE